MRRGLQKQRVILLIALGCLLFPLSAWPASAGDERVNDAVATRPAETQLDATLERDKLRPESRSHGGSTDPERPLQELSVKAVKVCSNDEQELNLPGSLLVALPAGTIHRIELRKQKKPPKLLLGLVLNGIFMEGIYPQHVSIAQDGTQRRVSPNGCSWSRDDSDSPEDYLLFKLSFNTRYRAAWESVLGGNKGINISVSVGFSDGEVMFSDQTINIRPSSLDWALSAGLAILLFAGFIMIILKSYMLTEAPDHVSYSLGRTQMAWWTVLTVWGFFFIYQYTGTADVTNSVVVLMGISSATGLGAVLIDREHTKKEDAKKEDTKKEDAKTEEPKKEGARNERRTEHASKPCVPQRNHFFAKLLSDPSDSLNDYSLHRVQIFCWNLAMSYVFLRSVVINYTMPEFDNTLLALMGVSSAAYLGFKRQENSVPVAAGTGSAAR